MRMNEGRFKFQDRELQLIVDGERKISMTDDSIRTMINLLPDHYFNDIINNFRSWLDENGHKDITEKEFNFITEMVNRQVQKMNVQQQAAQHNIRR